MCMCVCVCECVYHQTTTSLFLIPGHSTLLKDWAAECKHSLINTAGLWRRSSVTFNHDLGFSLALGCALLIITLKAQGGKLCLNSWPDIFLALSGFGFWFLPQFFFCVTVILLMHTNVWELVVLEIWPKLAHDIWPTQSTTKLIIIWWHVEPSTIR